MSLRLLIASLSLIPLAACTTGGPSARRYDQGLAAQETPIEVDVHGDVLKLCHIPQDRAYFDTNSTALDARERTFLAAVAECMNRGAAEQRTLLITGHGDVRGARPYNDDLGLMRARAVAHELYRRGVPARRLYVRSRGERQAVFTNPSRPERMDYDRRVELKLIDQDM